MSARAPDFDEDKLGGSLLDYWPAIYGECPPSPVSALSASKGGAAEGDGAGRGREGRSFDRRRPGAWRRVSPPPGAGLLALRRCTPAERGWCMWLDLTACSVESRLSED